MSNLPKSYETSFNTSLKLKEINADEIADKVAEVTSLLPVSCENLLESSLPSLHRSNLDNASKSSIIFEQCSSQDGKTIKIPAATIHEEFEFINDDSRTSLEVSSIADYRCTPPSTAPLPIKFHFNYKKLAINSILRSDTDLIKCDLNPCRLEQFNKIKQSGTSDIFSDNGEKLDKKTDKGQINQCLKHCKPLKFSGKSTSLSHNSVENDNAISTSDYSSASRITLYVSSHGSEPSICKLCLLNTQSIIVSGKNVLSPISDKSQEANNEQQMTVLKKNVFNNSIQPNLQQKKSSLRLELNSFKDLKPRLGKYQYVGFKVLIFGTQSKCL